MSVNNSMMWKGEQSEINLYCYLKEIYCWNLHWLPIRKHDTIWMRHFYAFLHLKSLEFFFYRLVQCGFFLFNCSWDQDRSPSVDRNLWWKLQSNIFFGKSVYASVSMETIYLTNKSFDFKKSFLSVCPLKCLTS